MSECDILLRIYCFADLILWNAVLYLLTRVFFRKDIFLPGYRIWPVLLIFSVVGVVAKFECQQVQLIGFLGDKLQTVLQVCEVLSGLSVREVERSEDVLPKPVRFFM